MKTQNAKTITSRSFLVAAAAVGTLLFSLTTQSFGQKDQAQRATTRDGLTVTGFMTNPEVSDDLEGTEDEYFYKFQVVPGKLTLTVEVTANETNAGAMLDLFGSNNKAILSNMLVQAADGGSERVSKSLNISKKQDVIIRIKGLRYGSSAGYPGTYKIVLEGPAANFKDVAPSGGAGAGTDESPVGSPTNESGQDKSPSAAPSDNKGQDTKPSTTSPADASKDKNPGTVDRVIDKAKKGGGKLLEVVEQVKKIKP